MSWLVAAVGIAWWTLFGAALALGMMIWRGRRLYSDENPLTRYRFWLGRRCSVKAARGWLDCTVVAVSHKGAVAVREESDKSGRHAFWVPKEKVAERVAWK